MRPCVAVAEIAAPLAVFIALMLLETLQSGPPSCNAQSVLAAPCEMGVPAHPGQTMSLLSFWSCLAQTLDNTGAGGVRGKVGEGEGGLRTMSSASGFALINGISILLLIPIHISNPTHAHTSSGHSS